MRSALQTKLLITIVALLTGIASYLAFEHRQRDIEQQKVNQAFQRMRTEGTQVLPSGWAKSLKNK
jgi:hypothetical protein